MYLRVATPPVGTYTEGRYVPICIAPVPLALIPPQRNSHSGSAPACTDLAPRPLLPHHPRGTHTKRRHHHVPTPYPMYFHTTPAEVLTQRVGPVSFHTTPEVLTQSVGTSVERLTCLGANMCSCWRQAMAAARTWPSVWSSITAHAHRRDERAAAIELLLPAGRGTFARVSHLGSQPTAPAGFYTS